jgi:hypothetical protein
LDADSTGNKALEESKTQGLLTDKDCHIASVAGKSESEMEDLYTVPLYDSYLVPKYGVSTQHSRFSGSKKWSDRLKLISDQTDKNWTDRLQNE